jgi:pyruvate, water dikinase
METTLTSVVLKLWICRIEKNLKTIIMISFRSLTRTLSFVKAKKSMTLMSTQTKNEEYIRWFKDLSMKDIPLVGGKNASLGEMRQTFGNLGVRVPDGFAVTAPAFSAAIDRERMKQLHNIFDGLDKTDIKALRIAGTKAREIVLKAPMPVLVESQLRDAWSTLKKERGGDSLSVAVRSSATAEDLPGASFAGQHDTYLNVKGEESLIEAVKKCQASLFTDRAICYRIDNNFDWAKVQTKIACSLCSRQLFTH